MVRVIGLLPENCRISFAGALQTARREFRRCDLFNNDYLPLRRRSRKRHEAVDVSEILIFVFLKSRRTISPDTLHDSIFTGKAFREFFYRFQYTVKSVRIFFFQIKLISRKTLFIELLVQ